MFVYGILKITNVSLQKNKKDLFKKVIYKAFEIVKTKKLKFRFGWGNKKKTKQ